MRPYILALLLSTSLLAHPLYFERQSPTRFQARLTSQTLQFRPGQLTIAGVTLRFLNTGPATTLTGLGQPAPATYLLGRTTQTRLQYPKLAFQHLYPGIDAVFYGTGDNLEYDLVISPGADLHRIRMSFDGATAIQPDPTGNLLITSARSSFTQKLPRVYQSDGRRIEAAYTLLPDHEVAFRIGRYNPRLPLTIDPELVFTKYFGGSGNDTPRAIATDAQGNVYIAGNTNSIDFPTTAGYQSKEQPPLIAISGTDGATISHLPVGNESSILAVGGTSDGSVLYAISPTATYVSSNQGATWTQNAPLVSSPISSIPGFGLQINTVSVDNIDPARVFVATNQGLFFTSQGGQSWFPYNYQLPSGANGPPGVSWVAISPIDHLTTYVAVMQPPVQDNERRRQLDASHTPLTHTTESRPLLLRRRPRAQRQRRLRRRPQRHPLQEHRRRRHLAIAEFQPLQPHVDRDRP